MEFLLLWLKYFLYICGIIILGFILLVIAGFILLEIYNFLFPLIGMNLMILLSIVICLLIMTGIHAYSVYKRQI